MPDAGRPSKLDPAIREKVVQALLLGTSRADAAQFAGIDARTLRRWLVKGAEEEEGEHADFRAAVLDAESRAKVTAMGTVSKALRDGDWRAAAWWLERRFPAEFGDRSVLFLVRNALAEMERAAEEAGVPLPPGVWEQAWTRAARDAARQLPDAIAGVSPGAPADLQGFETREDFETALKLLGRKRQHGNGSPP